MTAQLHTRPTVVSGHLKTLQQRFDAVCARAETESSLAHPDVELLQFLERERTRLSDELVRYEGLFRTVSRGAANAEQSRPSLTDGIHAS